MIRPSQAHSLVLGQVFRLFSPAVLVAAVLALASRRTSVVIPNWLGAIIVALTIPTYHIGHATLRYWRNARKAARLGAVLPPRWQGNLPGSYDLLQLVDQAYYRGFLSETFSFSSVNVAC